MCTYITHCDADTQRGSYPQHVQHAAVSRQQTKHELRGKLRDSFFGFVCHFQLVLDVAALTFWRLHGARIVKPVCDSFVALLMP